jgi:hypothetical protein
VKLNIRLVTEAMTGLAFSGTANSQNKYHRFVSVNRIIVNDRNNMASFQKISIQKQIKELSIYIRLFAICELAIIDKKTVMVEVFKTNVENINQAQQILKELKKNFPQLRIGFDLDDCD